MKKVIYLFIILSYILTWKITKVGSRYLAFTILNYCQRHKNKITNSVAIFFPPDILSRLASCQSQVVHLTSLLNESENNAARHEQQTNFLKEEIRRLERAVERQPHVKNTEYLKNVILKVSVG